MNFKPSLSCRGVKLALLGERGLESCTFGAVNAGVWSAHFSCEWCNSLLKIYDKSLWHIHYFAVIIGQRWIGGQHNVLLVQELYIPESFCPIIHVDL